MITVIHRTPKDKIHPFTPVLNEIIDNNKLSAEARIIIIKMIRNVDDYSYSIESISRSTGISLSKVTRAIRELQDNGYLRISKTKTTGHGAGRGFVTTYEIFETPVAKVSKLEGTGT